MMRTPVLLTSALGRAIRPASWSSLPGFLLAFSQVIDTNIPFWQWPRLLLALLSSVLFGIDSRTITCDMVTPFPTSRGAQVLAPNWDTNRLSWTQMLANQPPLPTTRIHGLRRALFLK